MRRLGLVVLLVCGMARAQSEWQQLRDQAQRAGREGRYTEAETILRQVLALREQELGAEGAGLVPAIAELTRNLITQGRPVDAQPLAARALAIQEKALGAESLELLPAISLLAGVHQALAENFRAEQLLLRGIVIRYRSQHPLHPELAADMHLLARFYMSQKRWQVAEPHLRQVLTIGEHHHGLDSPSLLGALDNLATLYGELQRFPEAEQALRRALVIRERTSGPMHGELAPTLDNLASILYRQKLYVDAEAVSTRALQIWKTALGEDHALLATVFDNLAVAQAAQEKLAAAGENYRHALAIREAAAARSFHNLARVAGAQGRLGEAESLYEAAQSLIDRLPPGSPLAEANLKHYAAVLRALKKEALAGKIEARLGLGIDTNFEGGRLGRIERLAETHFRCHLAGEVDQAKRNRQANWYYFRLDNAAGREVTIDLVDLPGEYNYKPNRGAVTADTPPVYSYDRKNWKHFDAIDYDARLPRMRLRFTPTAAVVWIAHVPPYTNRDLDRLLADFDHHPYLEKTVIGTSVGNRELLLATVTNPAVPAAGKMVVWLMFRQHAWEAGSSWAGEGALRFLLSTDPAAARIRDGAIFKLFPLCDPDGVARGGVRFNAHGFDLNRNWDVVDAKRMPEIAAQRRAILEWVDAGGRLDLFLSLHNTETAEYLDGPPDSEGRFTQLRDRLFGLLTAKTSFDASRPPRNAEPSTSPGLPGRMSVSQGLWRDRKLPAFLMEQRIARHPKLGRPPGVDDRLRFGADLVRVIWEAVRTDSPAAAL